VVAGDDGGDFVLHEQVRMVKAAREGGREGGRAGGKEGGGKLIVRYCHLDAYLHPSVHSSFPFSLTRRDRTDHSHENPKGRISQHGGRSPSREGGGRKGGRGGERARLEDEEDADAAADSGEGVETGPGALRG